MFAILSKADNGGVVMVNLYSGYLNNVAAAATIDDAVGKM